MSAKIPIILLVIWMIGSTWYWMCGVKDLCQGESVIDNSLTKTGD